MGFRQAEVVRCPFCVLDNDFRAMIDVTGGAAEIFYCTSCRHLIRTVGAGQCLCENCRANQASA
jgi:hypothetical protein